MKFSTLTLAAAALTIASFAHAADESQYSPRAMSMKSRAEVQAQAVGTRVPGESGYLWIGGQQIDMSKLTREEVRAMVRALQRHDNSPMLRDTLDQIGGM